MGNASCTALHHGDYSCTDDVCLCSKKEHASFKHGASPYISLLPLLLISLSCNISRSVTAVQIENPLMNQYLLQAAK